MFASTKSILPCHSYLGCPPAAATSDSPREHADAAGTPKVATILVIDDNASVRRYVAKALSRVGYVVDTVPGGEAALRRWPQQSYQLVILDARMPGLNGWQTYERLHRSYPETKFLFMSGYPDHDVWQKVLDAQLPHIGKPCSPIELRDKVAELI